PYNYYRRPSEQWAFATFAHLDIAPKVRAYLEFQYHDNHTVAQIAPSGIFFGSPDFIGPNALHFTNPLRCSGPNSWQSTIAANSGRRFTTPGDTADMLIGRRNIEGGGRQHDIRHSSDRGVLGFKGDVFQNWNYDAYYQEGRVWYQGVYRNDFSKARILKAMDVITNPATGLPACRSFVNGTDPNCVPYDIWRLGGVTQAALDYLQTPGLQNGSTAQRVLSGTMSADLGAYGIKMPDAKNGVGVVVGLENRKERLVLETDTEFSTFDLAGQGGPTIGVSGALDVSEVFQPQGNNLFGMNSDTCGSSPGPNNTVIPPTATFAQCQRTGITTIYDPNTNPTGQYGNPILFSPAGQFNFLQGGNVDLKPETANSFTLGLVATPLKNFTGTVDFWVIKVDDVISNAPPSTLLTQCL